MPVKKSHVLKDIERLSKEIKNNLGVETSVKYYMEDNAVSYVFSSDRMYNLFFFFDKDDHLTFIGLSQSEYSEYEKYIKDAKDANEISENLTQELYEVEEPITMYHFEEAVRQLKEKLAVDESIEIIYFKDDRCPICSRELINADSRIDLDAYICITNNCYWIRLNGGSGKYGKHAQIEIFGYPYKVDYERKGSKSFKLDKSQANLVRKKIQYYCENDRYIAEILERS